MSKVVLHMGLHKTGTSTMQRQFFPACSDVQLLTTSRPSVRVFIDAVTKTDPLYFSSREAQKLIAPLLSSTMTNLISNESLSGPPYAGVIEGGLDHRSPILANLKSVFPDARAIVILRRQDALAKSFYRQYLKSGGTRGIRRFYGLDGSGRPALMSLNRFIFSPYIDAVTDTFSSGVLIMPFEGFVEDQEGFLQRVTDFIGVRCPSVELNRENATSLGPLGMGIGRILNYFFRSLLNQAGLIPGIRTTQDGIPRRISPVQYLHDGWLGSASPGKPGKHVTVVAEEIFQSSKEDNRLLDKKYSLGLANYGYY